MEILQLPCLELEPIQQLAPYLSNLNGATFCDEFEKLADLVLSPSSSSSSSSSSDDDNDYDYEGQQHMDRGVNNVEQQLQQQVVFSAPADGDSRSCFSYDPNWSLQSSNYTDSPMSSYSSKQHSDYSSSSFYSPSYSYPSSASTFSSYPNSAASSICGDETHCSTGKQQTSGGNSRKRRNASAAERYRRKLKGRRCILVDELEREQERNEKLRRQIESKLALYSEYVSLLAQNTSDSDRELASLGARSLIEVLTNVVNADGQPAAPENDSLACHLARFQQILGQ